MSVRVTILTDVENFSRSAGEYPVEVHTVDPSMLAFVKQCARADLVILDETGKHLFMACLLRRLFRFKLLCVDPVLPRPGGGLVERLKAGIRRWLLAGADQFVLYFRNTAGYELHYGIDPERTRYIPFKANLAEPPGIPGDGGYVLCAGRSRRDVATFVRAMEQTGLPAVIVQQAGPIGAAHGTAPWRGDLPANVRTVIDHNDELWGLLRYARLIVIPRYKNDINATGISLCLSAMAYGKCVIISRGPGADDVLLDRQAAFVEPENVEHLAKTAKTLYWDTELRQGFATRGFAYAVSLEGEARLIRDLLQTGLELLGTPESRKSEFHRAG
jgi:glycosyltransferase involved in cell wall biosynthesis